MATRRKKNDDGKKKTGLLTYLKWAGVIGAGAVVGHIATKAYMDRFERPQQQAEAPRNPMFGGFNPFDTKNAPQINVFAAGAPPPPQPAPAPEPPPPAPPPDMRPSLTSLEDEDIDL